MKYPCWSEYDSVYDGVELEMHIVDHCNLNCAGCNHFCSLAEPFYITIEEFTNQLKLVKEKIPSLKWLMLLGGEPTLHPQLLELCIIARELFPNITIEVLSNGKDLSNIVDKRMEFDKLNISFTLARYNIEYNEEHINKLCELPNNGRSWGRESFTQTLVDITGSQDMEESFYLKCHHQLPCFTLQDYKIYECPFAAHIRHFIKKFHVDIPLIPYNDYLPLEDLTLDKLEYFAYQPKNICKYCKTGENWLWHLSDRSFDEYTKTLIELYFIDYDKYEKIKSLTPFSISNEVLTNVDPNFGLGLLDENKIKFNGKLDIIIPYYIITDEQIDNLIISLKQQTIIKDCMIYLISDNSPNEYQLINKFMNNIDLNVTFLKNQSRLGPGAARNKGIEKSFNKYLYFIDCDDYLFDPNSLEQTYNLISSSKFDVIATKRQNLYGEKYNQVDYMCSREFLNQYNIRFGNYFLHEDLFFTYQLEMYKGQILQSAFNGTIYNRNNDFNLSSITTSEDKIISKYFTLYKICARFKEEQDINKQSELINFIEHLLNQYADIQGEEKNTTISILDNPELTENIYYILLKSVFLVQEQININNLCELLQDLLNNQFIIHGSTVTNFKNLKQKVHLNFIKKRNNLFLQPIITELERR